MLKGETLNLNQFLWLDSYVNETFQRNQNMLFETLDICLQFESVYSRQKTLGLFLHFTEREV